MQVANKHTVRPKLGGRRFADVRPRLMYVGRPDGVIVNWQDRAACLQARRWHLLRTRQARSGFGFRRAT